MKFSVPGFIYSVVVLLALVAGSTAIGDATALAMQDTVVAAPRYPRTIELPEGTVVIQMPQIEAWDNYETLTGWAVVEVTPADGDKTWVGSVKFKARSDIDFDERLVVVHDLEVVERKFFDGIEPPDSVFEIARTAILLKPKSVPLEVVLRALPKDFQPPNSAPAKAAQLNHQPPQIFVSTKPAALMIINGDVVKAPIKDTGLEFVVNTNWDLFYDAAGKYYYVLNEATWQRTKSLTKPKWKTTTKLPAGFYKLPLEKRWQEVKKHLSAKKTKTKPPKIIVSFKPAEIILTDGKPEFEAITDTGIEWLTNTESDVFLHQDSYYYLVSGRWFTTEKMKGPWQSVAKLPPVFANIPDDHGKAHVLSSVPGTPAARVAVIEASIPRKASVSADAGAAIEVFYDGDPKFVPIENTGLKRAANTLSQVILADGSYYLCHNAVWFFSATPTGPWQVATSVPSAIYTIPASDPAHNVTYVYVFEQPKPTVTTHVTYAYTSGYYGYYSYGATVVYGSGWYYPPYYYYDPWGYPAYWNYPTSYGYGSWYSPTTGRYAERAVAYGPYGGAAASSVYNPRTGTYGRGWSAWDSDEVARSGYAYNPNTRAYAAGNMYYDFDDNEGWREGFVERGDRWVYSETKYDGNTARSEFETARGVEGASKRVKEGDTITGSGTINYKGRSAQTQSKIDGDQAEVDIQGDRGSSGSITKEFGKLGSEGSINTADGRSAQFQSQLTDQGRATKLEGAGGGKAGSVVNESGRMTLGKSEMGDLYAGKNGNVYKRNESGSWSQYQNGSWNNVSKGDRSKNTTSSQSYNRDRYNLNRQHNARQSGSRNYSQFQRQRGSMGMSRGSFGGGGRRR